MKTTRRAQTRQVAESGLAERAAPLEVAPDEFRRLGHDLVDRIADFFGTLRERPLTSGETPAEIRALLGRGPLPVGGSPPAALLAQAAPLLFEHSLFNGHPRFMGYITSSAAPIGVLADLLAATVNPNVGGWELSPMASEIEAQTVRWVAELVGYPADCGGLLVSGGNMANFVCFLAGRRAMLGETARDRRVGGGGGRLRVYASAATHTWIQKACDLFGLGTEAIRWIPVDSEQRMRADALAAQIRADLARAATGRSWWSGTAGSVSTGAVDPLRELADICRTHRLWFHVDGAYGAPAAVLPDAPDDLHALAPGGLARGGPAQVAVRAARSRLRAGARAASADRGLRLHAGILSLRDRGRGAAHQLLRAGHAEQPRASARSRCGSGCARRGAKGTSRMIGDDCRLAATLHRHVAQHPELEAATLGLSITTFRYVPPDLRGAGGSGGLSRTR